MNGSSDTARREVCARATRNGEDDMHGPSRWTTSWRGAAAGATALWMGLVVTAGACASAGGQEPRAAESPEATRQQAEPDAAAQGSAEVRNVVLFIGDGVGAAYWTAARRARGTLAVERMPVAGLTDTRSSDSYVTDSAAGATVYATGRRTYNGAIGVGPECATMYAADPAATMANPADCDPLEGVFDIAWEAGIGTGVVATSDITHATPASFAAKVPYRAMQDEIARQMAERPLQVILGGGRDRFDATARADSLDLLGPLCELAVCLRTAEELAAYRPDDRPLVGLFAPGHLGPASAGRAPTLPQMTRAALERLSRNPLGFILVVEGSQPDWRGHDNAPLSEVTAEMIDFDRAIEAGLEFAAERPETLVLVVADHETGGLSLVQRGDTLVAAYTTTSHTGEMTPHFAAGAGAEAFGGILDNDEVGRRLVEMARARAASAARSD